MRFPHRSRYILCNYMPLNADTQRAHDSDCLSSHLLQHLLRWHFVIHKPNTCPAVESSAMASQIMSSQHGLEGRIPPRNRSRHVPRLLRVLVLLDVVLHRHARCMVPVRVSDYCSPVVESRPDGCPLNVIMYCRLDSYGAAISCFEDRVLIGVRRRGLLCDNELPELANLQCRTFGSFILLFPGRHLRHLYILPRSATALPSKHRFRCGTYPAQGLPQRLRHS
jgi:hypothetical protein